MSTPDDGVGMPERDAVPASRGYRMPAEWTVHERCWMAWPCNAALWGSGLAAAREAYAEVAQTISRFEPVVMVARPEDAGEAEQLCGPEIEIMTLPIFDSWMRDMGPSFVVDRSGSVAGVDWGFNAWGNDEGRPQFELDTDDAIAAAVLERARAGRFRAPLILEGGSIHVDGEGTLITTEQCLLNRNRNPGLTREQIEDVLAGYLGVERIIWLGQGLEDDDTDGHVDNLACFARPGVVMAFACSDPEDPHHAIARENLARLRAACDANGRGLDLVEIEQPSPRRMANGRRLAMSYVNYYLPNGGVVVPGFDDPVRDANAVAVLREVFPDREVVQVPGIDIVRGGGNVHCITQQQPAGC